MLLLGGKKNHTHTHKKSAKVLQENSLPYLEWDQNGFPIKTWEDPHTSVTAVTLDSAQSLVLGRTK